MAASSTPPLPGLRFRFHRDFWIRSDATAWGCANAGTKDAPTKRPVETHLSGAIKDAATENDATGCDCFVSFLPPPSLCLSVLLPYPCCNPLGWTIMREKPCKYEPRRSIGRGESRQTESFTNCQLFVKGFVSEMYILLLISCSGTCPHFV